MKGITGENGITHFYKLNNQSTYVLDDWKVSSRLTLNVGLRWEFDGLLSDRLGTVDAGVAQPNGARTQHVPTSLGAGPHRPGERSAVRGAQQLRCSTSGATAGVGILTASNRTSSKGTPPTAISLRDSDLRGSR